MPRGGAAAVAVAAASAVALLYVLQAPAAFSAAAGHGLPVAERLAGAAVALRGFSRAYSAPRAAEGPGCTGCLAGVAVLASLGAVAAATARRRGGASAAAPRGGRRGDLVATRDGSSWGETGYDASSSLDTSGPLPFVRLKRGNDEAIVYLLGACVASYKARGQEWLATRADATFDGSTKAISAGLPICWPVFGPDDKMARHGFARNMTWRLLEEPSEAGVCVLQLTDTPATREMWPHNFRLEYRVELKDDRLSTTLTVENPSQSAFSFTGALHSYYSVFDIGTCSITGFFKDAMKLEKTEDPPRICKGDSDTIHITKFTEEIYKEILPGTVGLMDPSKGELWIESGGGWRDCVIWNPYGVEQYGPDNFVCVESAACAEVPVAPQGTWRATMDLVPKPL